MSVKVSICIPTYNGSKYLKESLDSVLSQTFTDLEILIVDDCSSDNTVEIAQAYAQQDSRIKVIVNERNLGLVGNWNKCIELAHGEWIKFVFQDDLIAPNCIESMVAARQPEIPIIFCRRQFIFEEGTPKEHQKYHLSTLSLLDKIINNKTYLPPIEYSQIILDQISANSFYYQPITFVGEPVAIMLHRKVFYQFGVFNNSFIQACDFEYWTRIIINTGITYVPETLVTFRVHGSSTTAVNTGSRQYYKSTLESLIILHDFAFHPAYAPLRALANEQTSVNLVKVLAEKAYHARRMAERSMTNVKHSDINLLAQWENLCKLYPMILTLSQRSLLKRIINYSSYRLHQLSRTVKKIQ